MRARPSAWLGSVLSGRVTQPAPARPSTLVLGPHDVPFTQYLRPDGRTRATCVERAPAIAALARQVIAAGYHFDIEELSDGTVSMTCEPNRPGPDGEDAPIAHGLCQNGPAVPMAVDRLIERAADAIGVR
jgi:hypothetical protein